MRALTREDAEFEFFADSRTTNAVKRTCLCCRPWARVSNRMTTLDRYAFLAARAAALCSAAFLVSTLSPVPAIGIALRYAAHRGSRLRLVTDVACDLATTPFALALGAPYEAVELGAALAAVTVVVAAPDRVRGAAFAACVAMAAAAALGVSRYASAAVAVAAPALFGIAAAALGARGWGWTGDVAAFAAVAFTVARSLRASAR